MSQDYVEQTAIAVMKLAAKLVRRKLFSRRRQSPQPAEEPDPAGSGGDDVLKHNSTSEQTTDEQTTTGGEQEKPEQSENTENKSNADSDIKAGPSSGGGKTIEGDDTIDNGTECESAVIESDSRPDVEDENDAIPAHSSILFHFSIFLVWVIVTGLNVPVVLTWARNFR